MVGGCEHNIKQFPCSKSGMEYKRTDKEAEEWPSKEMPITLCDKHAKNRVPIINLDKVMKRVFPLLCLCLSFVGCMAQNLEVIPTSLPVGNVVVVGNNRTVIGVPQSAFKGEKGDTGAQGIQGLPGKDATFILPGIDTAKEGTVWVSDGLGGLKPRVSTLTEDHGERFNVTSGGDISIVTAKKFMYEIAVAGKVNAYAGFLDFRVQYINSEGIPVEIGLGELTKTGEFSLGSTQIHVKLGTPITLLSRGSGAVNYNFSYNIHQQ